MSLVANIPAFPFHDTPLVGLQASPVPDFRDHGAQYMRIQKPLDDSVAKVNGLSSGMFDFTFVGIVKVECVQTNDGNLVWNDIHGVIGSSLEDPSIGEGDKRLPNSLDARDQPSPLTELRRTH